MPDLPVLTFKPPFSSFSPFILKYFILNIFLYHSIKSRDFTFEESRIPEIYFPGPGSKFWTFSLGLVSKKSFEGLSSY